MITFAEVDTMLRSAQPMLAATLYPAAGLLAVVFGFELYRLGDEDVHDVDDYKPAPVVPPVVRPRRRLRPAVPSQTPIHDTLAAQPMPEVVARRVANVWLEEIGAVEQAKAGNRPAYDPDRDMTGSFPVVAVAR